MPSCQRFWSVSGRDKGDFNIMNSRSSISLTAISTGPASLPLFLQTVNLVWIGSGGGGGGAPPKKYLPLRPQPIAQLSRLSLVVPVLTATGREPIFRRELTPKVNNLALLSERMWLIKNASWGDKTCLPLVW